MKVSNVRLLKVIFSQCKFINDVTVLGGRAQGFCDDSTKAVISKSLTIGGGGEGWWSNFDHNRTVV